MKAESTPPKALNLRLLAIGLSGFAAFLCAGCATSRNASIAPRSNVSREHALSLAQLAATAIGGEVFTVSATGSMKPTLDEGSVVTIERVAFTQLRKGDIVIYRNDSGNPVVHRLYERANNRWLVLGDNNPSVDRESVDATNLVGRVCAIFYTSGGGFASAPSAAASP
jgi:signal peptidase I